MSETAQIKTQEEAQVLRTGPLDMQVCVPESWDDEQVEYFANVENRAGTTMGWCIRRAGDAALVGDPERNPCTQRAGFVHIVLDC